MRKTEHGHSINYRVRCIEISYNLLVLVKEFTLSLSLAERAQKSDSLMMLQFTYGALNI